jgi:hypothetical protein
VATAAVVGPAAVFFTVGGGTYPLRVDKAADPVADRVAQCCIKAAAVVSPGVAQSSPIARSGMSVVSAQPVATSRWRVVYTSLLPPAGDAPEIPHLLPVGAAPEGGLQVRTIFVGRSISATFPEIHQIGGYREDPLRWHPDGLALDVMIPRSETKEGIALGNEIVSFVLKNAVQFGIQDAIWRGVYYTPSHPPVGAADHYDHVHVTTTGGGYPNGGKPRPRLVGMPRPSPVANDTQHLHFDGDPHLASGGGTNSHSGDDIIDLHSGGEITDLHSSREIIDLQSSAEPDPQPSAEPDAQPGGGGDTDPH